MKPILLAIAAALAGAANGLTSLANGEPITDTTGDTSPASTGKRGPGRPKAAEPTPAAAVPAGPSDEERFEKNRALIKPLVDGGQGAEVKKITEKYCKPGTSGIKNILPENQAAFETDIEALTY